MSSYERIDFEDSDGDKSVHSSRTTHYGDPNHAKSAQRLQWFISLAAGTVMCLFGYEQGLFGGLVVGEKFLTYFHNPSPSKLGFVTSVYDLGCLLGAILALLIGEQLGRKRMLLLFTIIMAAGILIQTAAHSMTNLVWGRVIAGIGNGGNTATAPVWHVETSKQSGKGKAVVKEMVVNAFGFILPNLITLACSGIGTEAQWRFPLGIQLLLVLIILIMVPLLPESPRWLISRSRDMEARTVLSTLSEDDGEEDFIAIRQSVRDEQTTEASWSQLFQGGQATRRVVLGMLIQVCQQLTGINILCYFLPLVIQKSVGWQEFASRVGASCLAFLFMFAAAGSLFFIERFGRRPLLMWMAAVQSVAFLGVAISTGGDHGKISGIIAIICISLYFVAFGSGWIAIPWLYPAEVNSLSMRTKGAALATACNWLVNYAVVQTTPIGIHYLGWGIYLVYAVFNLSFVPVVYYLIVETAGKTLEQCDEWFAANPGWLVHKVHHSLPSDSPSAEEGVSTAIEEENEGLIHPLHNSGRNRSSAAIDSVEEDE